MADGGELAAAFRALAEDSAQAGEDVGSSIGKWFDDTADIEDENVARTLAADSENARALNAIRPNADTGALGDGADADAGDGAGSSEENRISRLLSGEGDEAPVAGQTGGTMRPRLDGTIRSYDLDEKWATDAYESIRSADDVGDIASNVRDVPRLDGSTGFTPEEIQTVKDHVFFDEHPLAGIDGGTVTSRFDSSPDMAEAWLIRDTVQVCASEMPGSHTRSPISLIGIQLRSWCRNDSSRRTASTYRQVRVGRQSISAAGRADRRASAGVLFGCPLV